MKKPKRKHMTARIDQNLFNLLESRSNDNQVPRSRLIERAIELYLSADFSEATQQKSA